MAKFKPLPPSGEQHKADNSYPITPPKKLVDQWFEASVLEGEITYDEYNFANLAARWGADQELEACVEWLEYNYPLVSIHHLRAARRPKPKSQTEEALEEIQEIEGAIYNAGLGCDFTATRRALERLQELEGQPNG